MKQQQASYQHNTSEVVQITEDWLRRALQIFLIAHRAGSFNDVKYCSLLKLTNRRRRRGRGGIKYHHHNDNTSFTQTTRHLRRRFHISQLKYIFMRSTFPSKKVARQGCSNIPIVLRRNYLNVWTCGRVGQFLNINDVNWIINGRFRKRWVTLHLTLLTKDIDSIQQLRPLLAETIYVRTIYSKAYSTF